MNHGFDVEIFTETEGNFESQYRDKSFHEVRDYEHNGLATNYFMGTQFGQNQILSNGNADRVEMQVKETAFWYNF